MRCFFLSFLCQVARKSPIDSGAHNIVSNDREGKRTTTQFLFTVHCSVRPSFDVRSFFLRVSSYFLDSSVDDGHVIPRGAKWSRWLLFHSRVRRTFQCECHISVSFPDTVNNSFKSLEGSDSNGISNSSLAVSSRQESRWRDSKWALSIVFVVLYTSGERSFFSVERFKQLQEAKEVLCDDVQRKAYDHWRNSHLTVPWKTWQAMSERSQPVRQ